MYLTRMAQQIRSLTAPNAQPPYNDIRLYLLYALLARTKGTATTREDVHDAWAVWAQEHRPQSVCIVPFDELPPSVQAEDEPFVRAIHIVAEGHGYEMAHLMMSVPAKD